MKTPIAAMLGLTWALAACSPGSGRQDVQGDRFAGLDGAIRAWRADLLASHPACGDKSQGKGCQDFEVGCKGELAPTPADRAEGVTARVVTAMTFNGWDPGRGGYSPASAFAEFRRTGEGWSRRETAPVNLASCASG